MKESKKLALKEWATERGMNIADYDNAGKHKRDYDGYFASTWFYLAILAIVTIAFVVQGQQIEATYDRCIDLVKNLPYDQAVRNCQDLVYGVRP